MKILVLCHGCGNDSSVTGKPDDCVECLKRDRSLLIELSGYAVALRITDPVALAYDGATTRGVIVARLQDWADRRRAP